MTIRAGRAGDLEATLRTRRRAVLALLVSAQLVVMLDVSIVNVALPSIQADLGAGSIALTWVVNAYALAFGGLLLLAGRVTDLVGRRRMFVAGCAVFTAGTVLAATADHTWVLVMARAVQGLGAAALSPAALSLLLLTSPGPARARAMGAWSAASAVGGAAGVVLGGLLAGSFGWRANFLVTVPVTLVAAVAARRLLPADETGPRPRVDALGAALLATTTIALVHGVLDAASGGWATARVVLSLAVAMVAGVGFVVTERRASEPLIPVGLFRSPTLTTGVAAALLGGAARASSFVLVALYLQQALALAPGRAGLAMVPTSATVFVVSLLVLPRLLRSHGPARTMVAGLLVLAAGHLWLAQAPGGASYAIGVLPGLLLVATGVALSFTPTTLVITTAYRSSTPASLPAWRVRDPGRFRGRNRRLRCGGRRRRWWPGHPHAGGILSRLHRRCCGRADHRSPGSDPGPGHTASAALGRTTPLGDRRGPGPPADPGRGPGRLGRRQPRRSDRGIAGPRTGERRRALDSLLRDRLKGGLVPGAPVAVAQETKVDRLAEFGRGFRRDEAAGGDPVPGGITEQVVHRAGGDATCGGGSRQLDDPVVEHLPEFRLADPRGADIDGASAVSSRPPVSRTPRCTRSARPPPSIAPSRPSPDLRSLHVWRRRPAPQWNYHNPNYQVAARLVEVWRRGRSGHTWRDHVFGPAGMTSSTTFETGDQAYPGAG